MWDRSDPTGPSGAGSTGLTGTTGPQGVATNTGATCLDPADNGTNRSVWLCGRCRSNWAYKLQPGSEHGHWSDGQYRLDGTPRHARYSRINRSYRIHWHFFNGRHRPNRTYWKSDYSWLSGKHRHSIQGGQQYFCGDDGSIHTKIVGHVFKCVECHYWFVYRSDDSTIFIYSERISNSGCI